MIQQENLTMSVADSKFFPGRRNRRAPPNEIVAIRILCSHPVITLNSILNECLKIRLRLLIAREN